ncbi:MAG TPA: glycerate kinase [Candidatus Binatia bacterium]|nr:glycerate kinase [Candidatus Binatia bacterium]
MFSLPQLRGDARGIFDAGLTAANPYDAVNRQVIRKGDTLTVAGEPYDLSSYRNVYVVGAGKAAAKMASAVEELLRDHISSGIVIVKYGHKLPLSLVEIIDAGHPLPDEAGVAGTTRIIDLLRRATEGDLVVLLLSGGGSALLPCPVDEITLEDKIRTTQTLLDCGATIHEVNTVRKHISKIKGGRLARLAYPATLVSLILSDVVGDSLDVIASGPTVPDSSSFADCLRVIARYKLQEKIPPRVRAFLESGARGEVEETPKAEDPIFQKVRNVIVGNNRTALDAARLKAEELGYNTLLLSNRMEGEAKVVAAAHAAIARDIIATNTPIRRPACVLSGGETTVTVRGKGLGGRNQEFALAAAAAIDGAEGVVILSGGTDGTDGPTDAAGGVIDGTTLQRGRDKGLDAADFLRRNDSHTFLRAVGDLLVTGPTFTNVMDLRLVLIV